MAIASDSSPLTTGPVVVRFDGSVKDATHHDEASAAIGYVIEDVSTGECIVRSSRRLTYWVSNTPVEFDAFLAALDELIERGFTGHVYAYGDCKSVIQLADPNEGMTPNSRLMSEYVKLVRDRLAEFESYSLNHVKREKNEAAHEIAKEGHFDSVNR